MSELLTVIISIIVLILSIILLLKKSSETFHFQPVVQSAFEQSKESPSSNKNPNQALGATLQVIQSGHYTDGCNQFKDLCLYSPTDDPNRGEACDNYLKCKQMQNLDVRNISGLIGGVGGL